MSQMIESVLRDPTCKELRVSALASHAACYQKNGICSVNCSDWNILLRLMENGGSDDLSKEGAKQANSYLITRILPGCPVQTK